ncbi:alpha/beta hydrolase [Streptantibioticus cattleyicolor]|uniref:Alpha/beta hydrolase fold protein n=1 Tax=Streptantibioticus cattleyicolor (strain ATCC 35852 / DSM 46488 / JCM 4925 / NBRC 14057 / NRRL 8057) TaxID=1003195 RepID=F8JNB6_STREN|nr:alpha/beta fold hydrolase [Streptantibioticus cattleyicolor]AEW99125.1 alpha/beta hydrolase fold protein [Streptantibioticus cattleyicolor NRRL 8057 = DSM 46488]CCB71833.1 Similar to hydrolases or acyltransferases (Alpha/beta hydrolase superfamily) [Streptantibioticus cattleyicolor NRRL 8057 = DSM 46488]
MSRSDTNVPPSVPWSSARDYAELNVPVRGGELTVLRRAAREPGAPVVLALHGITANALAWSRVADHLAGRVTVVAPDLRGRAGSRALPGPYGIGAHAEDVAAVAEALGLESAVLAGHSMGAFVAALTAVRHPGRFASVVLVDGGLAFPAPAGLGTDELLEAVIGPAMRRLRMTFPDRDAYRDYWRVHPAFGGRWSPWTDAYLQRDLTGAEPELTSSCVLDAVREDGAGVFGDPRVRSAIRELPHPARLLWAERGLLDEPQGLYDEERLATAALEPDRVATHRIPDTNHYTVLGGDAGARAVAGHLLDAAGLR